MTNRDLLIDAIEALERQELTFTVAAKLADLYVVRDHFDAQPDKEPVKTAPAQSLEATSDFIRAVSKDPAGAWAVMDELMTVLQATNPRLYDGVMQKLM